MSVSKDPENKILTPTNIVAWSQDFIDSIFHFGPFAKQLTTGIRYYQTLPTKFDKDPDGDYIYPGTISTNLSSLGPNSPTIPEKYTLSNEGKVLFLSHLEKKTSSFQI
jgi:hypothetical protein